MDERRTSEVKKSPEHHRRTYRVFVFVSFQHVDGYIEKRQEANETK
jgi:hypothetical protein